MALAQNLEAFTLVWLVDQAAMETTTNSNIQQQQEEQTLRKAVNDLKIFDNADECVDYITDAREDEENIILLVTGRLARHIIPFIQDFQQLTDIYIQCKSENVERNKEWTKDYKKVCSIGTSVVQEIISKVSAGRQKYRQKLEAITSLPMFTYTSTTCSSSSSNNSVQQETQKQRSSSEINGDFLWFQHLVELLLRMKCKESDRSELIELCKANYIGNTSELQKIADFQQNYTSDRALWWYTRDTCLYRILNLALRTQDIDTLISFRSFIRDIYNQLKQLHNNLISYRVYRYQLMSIEELQNIKMMIGNYVSINSFFSTTLDQDMATDIISLVPITVDGLQPVLFEIDIDTTILDENIKPYADISSQSHFGEEKEILFMLGSIFKIKDFITSTTDGYSIVKLQLAGENDSQLKELSDYMKQTFDKNDPSLIILGRILRDMGQYDKANTCFNRQLKEIPDISKNLIEAACCYEGLQSVAQLTHNYDLAAEYFEQGFKLQRRIPYNEKILMGSYTNLASMYGDKGDHEKALGYYRLAVEIRKKLHGDDSLEVATLYYNMADCYDQQGKHDDAPLYYNQTLAIQQKHLPADHYEIGKTLTNIGSVYYLMGSLQIALEYFQRSLDVKLKSLPSTHPSVLGTQENIERTKNILNVTLIPDRRYSLNELLGDDGQAFVNSENGRRIPIADALKDKTTIGLYFSDHSLPDCREFTLRLSEIYKQMQLTTTITTFDIIFFPVDSFTGNQNESFDIIMPWKTMARSNKEKTFLLLINLLRYFDIQSFPCIIILRTSDGEVITKNGCEDIDRMKLKAIEAWSRSENVAVIDLLTTITSNEEFVWSSVSCDECGMHPLIGLRFRCKICDNYDLCKTCQQNKGHDHELHLILPYSKTDNDEQGY